VVQTSSSPPPPKQRFTLAKLLIGVTLICVLFGLLGVPITLYLAAWLLGMGFYFLVSQRLGTAPAVLAFLGYIWLVMLALQGVHFVFR
jgi:hypothetical protein